MKPIVSLFLLTAVVSVLMLSSCRTIIDPDGGNAGTKQTVRNHR